MIDRSVLSIRNHAIEMKLQTSPYAMEVKGINLDIQNISDKQTSVLRLSGYLPSGYVVLDGSSLVSLLALIERYQHNQEARYDHLTDLLCKYIYYKILLRFAFEDENQRSLEEWFS